MWKHPRLAAFGYMLGMNFIVKVGGKCLLEIQF